MNSIEKFYSDAQKCIKNEDVKTELPKLFCKAVSSFDKRAVQAANSLADYWVLKYSGGLHSPEQAVEWFYNAAAFLDGSFEADMDFTQDDWEEIKLILSAEAAEMDMDLLNGLMGIIVSRNKI